MISGERQELPGEALQRGDGARRRGAHGAPDAPRGLRGVS